METAGREQEKQKKVPSSEYSPKKNERRSFVNKRRELLVDGPYLALFQSTKPEF